MLDTHTMSYQNIPARPSTTVTSEPHVFEDALGATPLGFRRSSRSTKIPSKYDDFVLGGKYKFGIERTIGYASLDSESKCFASILNKSVEPSNYRDAMTDPNWVRAMNDEMEALNQNGT